MSPGPTAGLGTGGYEVTAAHNPPGSPGSTSAAADQERGAIIPDDWTACFRASAGAPLRYTSPDRTALGHDVCDAEVNFWPRLWFALANSPQAKEVIPPTCSRRYRASRSRGGRSSAYRNQRDRPDHLFDALRQAGFPYSQCEPTALRQKARLFLTQVAVAGPVAREVRGPLWVKSGNTHTDQMLSLRTQKRTSDPANSPVHALERTFLHANEGRRLLVSHLDPSPSPARTVWRIDPLGHDTLRPQLAGVSKDGRAVRFDMFTQSNARLGLPLIHPTGQ